MTFFCIFFGVPLPFFQLDTCIDDNCYDYHFYTISFTNYDLFLFDSFCCILVHTLGLRMAAPGTSIGGSPVDIIIINGLLFCIVTRSNANCHICSMSRANHVHNSLHLNQVNGNG